MEGERTGHTHQVLHALQGGLGTPTCCYLHLTLAVFCLLKFGFYISHRKLCWHLYALHHPSLTSSLFRLAPVHAIPGFGMFCETTLKLWGRISTLWAFPAAFSLRLQVCLDNDTAKAADEGLPKSSRLFRISGLSDHHGTSKRQTVHWAFVPARAAPYGSQHATETLFLGSSPFLKHNHEKKRQFSSQSVPETKVFLYQMRTTPGQKAQGMLLISPSFDTIPSGLCSAVIYDLNLSAVVIWSFKSF